ncbi:MAG TPA: tRNA (adenosine(37)-N6)-threonylcarbamoyltransferase complex dimerization subunit type 1 TsaB [Vicinamibacterales bacterium]|jgi:tRNA threonylcarbamoyladenosine biosynthesis protein TsaB
MQVLALDTTGRRGSIAIVRGDDRDVTVAEYAGDASRSHAERLPADILELLRANEIPLSAIDCFAVASGPGSFTGLRIGIATLQGLALVTRRPMVGVSALAALAHLAGEGRARGDRVGVWMDGYRREVFAALYDVTDEPPFTLGRLIEIEGATVGDPAATMDRWIELGPPPALFIGDGAELYRDRIASAAAGARILPTPLLAGAIGRVAVAHALRGETVSPSGIQPLYVRRPDAELARDHALAHRGPDVAPAD